MYEITLYYKDDREPKTYFGDYKVYSTGFLEINVKEAQENSLVAGLEKMRTVGIPVNNLERYEIIEA